MTTSESFKARTIFIFQHLSYYEQLKFHAQLSFEFEKSFITSDVFSRLESIIHHRVSDGDIRT